ncbi:MAG: tail fiber domain-containing protein, partial [Candidatus Spechtbacterales bacterium]
GNVGIGTTSPGMKLDVNQSVSGVSVIQATSPTGWINFGSLNTSFAHFYTDRPAFYFGAPVHSNGGFFYYSDISLKENIRPLEGALEKVLRLEGVSFNWKEDGKASIGLVAQNVEDIFPDVVATDPVSGLKVLKADTLIAPVIEAVKELFARQNEQQAEIDELKLKIEELETRLGEATDLEMPAINQTLQCLPN